MTSEKEVLDAALLALAAANASGYSLAQLAGLTAKPTSYNEVMVAQKYPDAPRRTGGASGTTQWRILTRAVADKYTNAQEMRRRAALALEDQKLTVSGQVVFVERALSDDPISADDGWWSGMSEFSTAV